MMPVYLRGEAHLALHEGAEATAEFQKILERRGLVQNSPIGALAHLQIGRAYAMQGDLLGAAGQRMGRQAIIAPEQLERSDAYLQHQR